MTFNSDLNKQATEVLFPRKINSDYHPKLTFHGICYYRKNAHDRKTQDCFWTKNLNLNKHQRKLVNVIK